MAKFVLDDADVTINAVDLSVYVKSVTINYEAEVKDITAMGDDGREKLAGLRNGSIEIEFFQDFVAAKVDATLFPLVGAAEFTVLILPTSAAVGADNPLYTSSCILASYSPIRGSVGDEATATATFECSGLIVRTVA